MNGLPTTRGLGHPDCPTCNALCNPVYVADVAPVLRLILRILRRFGILYDELASVIDEHTLIVDLRAPDMRQR